MQTGAPASGAQVLLRRAGAFAIVTTQWYADLMALLVQDARDTLLRSGAKEVDVFTVPGSFELPLVTARLTTRYDAVLCFGCIVRGETRHNEYISQAVTSELLRISVDTQKPVILGVLTTETYAQALARANGEHSRKGEECACAAIQMCNLLAGELS